MLTVCLWRTGVIQVAAFVSDRLPPFLKFTLERYLAFSIFPRLGKMLYLAFETFV